MLRKFLNIMHLIYYLVSAVARVDMPYSSAQLINHPGPGIMPNVVNIDFDWSEYLDYIASTDEDLNMEEEKKRIEQVRANTH